MEEVRIEGETPLLDAALAKEEAKPRSPFTCADLCVLSQTCTKLWRTAASEQLRKCLTQGGATFVPTDHEIRYFEADRRQQASSD